MQNVNRSESVAKHRRHIREMFEKIPKRYILCLFAFTGLTFLGIVRSALAIAIVAMVKRPNKHTNHSANSTIEEGFEWSSTVQGYVLSAFFFTYALAQFPVGFLSMRVSGRLLIGVGMGLLGLLNVVLPSCAKWGSLPLFILRLLQGVCGAVFAPTMHTLWTRWAPKQDQALLPTFTFSGIYVGTTLTMSCGGLIASYWSWTWIFYISGILTVLWSILWFFFVSESPAEHPTITEEELRYIEANLNKSISEKYSTPWKKIFTSLPVLSIAIAHFAVNLTMYFFLNELPTFLTAMLEFSVKKAGLWSAIPWVFYCIAMWFGGFIADKLRQMYQIIQVRKSIVGISSLVMIFWLFLMIVISVRFPEIILLCTCFILAAAGFDVAGFFSNHLEIGAQYAGVLLGLTNGISSISGMIIPILTGEIVHDQHSKSEWNIVLIILIGVCLVGAASYLLFGSGELQDWVERDPTESEYVLKKSPSVVLHDSNPTTSTFFDDSK